MKTFNSFLLEQEKKTLLILTTPTSAKNPVNTENICKDEWKMLEICKTINQPVHLLFTKNLFFEKLNNSKIKILNSRFKEPETYEFYPNEIRVLIRSNLNSNGQAFYDFLKENNVFIINSKECIDICGDKFKTEQALKKHNITTTESIIISDENSLKEAVEKLEDKFPIIIKTVKGSLGKGVIKVSKPEELLSVIQAMWVLDSEAEMLIQRFYEIDGDIRTVIIDGKIVGAIKRKLISGDFRSNITLGAETEPYNLNDEEKDIVIRAHNAVGANYSGVDHIIVDEKPLVIEVNSCCGTTGIDKTLRKSITKILIDYTLNGYL